MRHERGFSLLETIAAILLLAIAFGALMQVSSGSMHATSLVRTRSQASMWADTKLEALGRTEPLVAGNSSGHFDGGFDWRLHIAPIPAERPELRLYRVDLDVEWQEGKKASRLSLSTMKLDVQIAHAASTAGAG